MENFHTLDWVERPRLLELLSDSRAQVLAKRLIYVEAPAALSDAERKNLDITIARRLLGADGPVPWLTLSKALADTRDLLAVASGAKATLLDNLHGYLVNRSEEAEAAIA